MFFFIRISIFHNFQIKTLANYDTSLYLQFNKVISILECVRQDIPNSLIGFLQTALTWRDVQVHAIKHFNIIVYLELTH